MPGVLRHSTDLRGLAARRAIVAEELSASALPGLAAMLAEPDCPVACSIRLELDEAGNVTVAGTVDADLSLVCQRCLEPVRLDRQVQIRAAVAATDARVSRLENDFETVLPAGPVRLADLVEQELLLALPLVPMHPDAGECGPLADRLATDDADEHEPRAADSPFAVLGALKLK